MKIVVMSDTHGAVDHLIDVTQLHQDADMFIHLGDGERDLYHLFSNYPQLEQKTHTLKGNCDYGILSQSLKTLLLNLPYGHKLFAAHGDFYRVKYSTDRIIHEAKEHEADILLYGHTHVCDCRYENGLYIINPGSLGAPRFDRKYSYALLDISEQGILANIAYL
ncbi:MAG: YfcE family phosphodiesterase [Oscillospiraceae bacterium]|nr:YfcE family phosphodiesterase [Oscillospiraceae bacterium]